jgi:hypothetical protein
VRSTRLPRLLAIAAVGSVLVPVPALLSAAHGAPLLTTRVTVSQTNWFWRGQPGVIGGTGAAPPQQVPDPLVPAGDLAVAGPEIPAAAGSAQGPLAETYLAFDMSSIPVGSTITSFDLSLPVDPGGVSADPLGASIIACTPKAAWSSGQGAASYEGKPADACDVHSPKLTPTNGGKTYTANIAAIAQQWLKPNALNLGVAIRDNPANSATVYQVVFGPASALGQLTARVTYRAPAAAGPIVAGAGGKATSPSPVAAVPPTNVVAPPAPPPSSSGQPAQVSTPPAPVVAPRSPATLATAQPADGSTPPLGFWIALALVVLLLGATVVVLADPRVVVVRTPDRGVAKALRSRLILTPREASRS